MCSLLENDIASKPCVFSQVEISPDWILSKPPNKKKPFSTILNHGAAHTIDLALPEDLWLLVQDTLNDEVGRIEYHQISMTLLQLISGDFFNHFIKTGNSLMISQGRRYIDNRFRLEDGILKLEVEKAVYERLGLVGKAMPGLGRKHATQLFVIELNLRLPSMVQGKKGFDRIISAFSRELIEPVKWLFTNLQPSKDMKTDNSVLGQYDTKPITTGPVIKSTFQATIPLVSSTEAYQDEEYQEELLEWIGLIGIESPRIHQDDKINEYLCKYQLPGEALSDKAPECVIKVQWRGLITPRFIIQLFAMLKDKQPEKWFALNVKNYEDKTYTIMSKAAKDVLVWEI